MNNVVLFSCTLLTSSFLSFPLSAECIPSPNCADLGYDQASCSAGDGVLKCPFDTTKVKCVGNSSKTCEAIGKKTCGDLCVTESFWGCCNDSDCPLGHTCVTEGNTCLILAQIGDIYYSDGSYSTNLMTGKTPIGVVGYVSNDRKKGLVLSLDTTYDDNGLVWGCGGTDLSLYNYNSTAAGQNDFSGKSNTQTILNECSTRPIAASYCNEYTIEGVSGWHLPAYGELFAILYNNFFAVNTGLGKISADNQMTKGRGYWTSTESYATSSWTQNSGGTGGGINNKNAEKSVRCVLAF